MVNFIVAILFIAVLCYVAMIYTSEALLLLAFSSAAFVVLAFVFLCIQGWLLQGKLEVPIDVTDAGNAAVVQVKLKKRGFLACFRVKIALEVKNSFGQGRSRVWLKLSKVLPGENIAEYSMTFEGAGCYEVCLSRCRVYDLTGMFAWPKRMKGSRSIQVLPEIREVGVVLTEPVRNFFGDADVYDEERAGHDNSEIFQIRPFMAGDKVQSIHWKLSARTDELMVKESSLPKACPVVFLVGFSHKTHGKGTAGGFLEIVASVSFSLMDAGCPHYVAWFEEQTGEITRLRVDDEESYYLFFSCYLREQPAAGRRVRAGNLSPEELLNRYNEKYKAERYLYSLCVTELLALYKNRERICQFTDEKYRQQLGGLEIVL